MSGKTFFKNLIAYRLPCNWAMTADHLAEQLEKKKFAPCGEQEAQSSGFVPPRGDEFGPLVHAVNGQFLVTIQSQTRLLPSSVVKDAAAERAREISEREGRKVGRKEMKELKEQVFQELLPKAFLKTSFVRAWINPVAGWLVVDAGSSGKADMVLEHLNKVIDNFPVKRLNTVIPPEAAMADWLASSEAPTGMTVDRDCELKSPAEEKAAVRYVRHALDGDDVRQHLANGKRPTRLGLTLNDRVSFVLTAKQEIKSVSLLDVMVEDAISAAEDADDIFNAEFLLMSGEYTQLLDAVVAALGGEATES